MSTAPACCFVIPPHILRKVAEQPGHEARDDARATLERMRELAGERARTFAGAPTAAAAVATPPAKRRHVYDARHSFRLPGKLAMSEQKQPSSADVEVVEAYDGSGTTFDFFAKAFSRLSIDGRGMRIDSSVHYGWRFDNAMWNGRQMVYGDGDGVLFNRFTASLDVMAHELTHGVTQFTAALGYAGQNGALNEHISDAFGIMAKQFALGQTARESDWLIGAGLFTSRVHGRAVRSMAAPGTAYDDPTLGRDPQPAHMRHYVETDEDNGGVHINSGIPNHAFYRAAMALGGRTWDVLGDIWYAALTERLTPDADFRDFARATVDVAGERFGNGGCVQHYIPEAWGAGGLAVPIFETQRTANKPPAPAARARTRHRSRQRQSHERRTTS